MSKVEVNAPKTPVTEGSSGVAAATLPNICKMPGPPAPFVPTPLPNIGKSGSSTNKYSKSVTIEGKKVAIRGSTFGSMGDVASKGTGGGLVSANVEGPTSFVGPGSMNVKIEGKNVQLLGDPMLNNCGPGGSPANSATLMGLVQDPGKPITVVTGEDQCPLCDQTHGPSGELKETDKTKDHANTLAKALSTMNEAPPPQKRFPKRVGGKMLGVVHCQCEKIYADHSGNTEAKFHKTVKEELEWLSPDTLNGKTSIDVSLKNKNGQDVKTKSIRVRESLKQLCAKSNSVDPRRVDTAWRRADHAYSLSEVYGKEFPAAFPPGSCAGPKALMFALGDGAYATGLTEQWFHYEGKHTDGEIIHKVVHSNGISLAVRAFGHGESVPPCRSCNIILPLLLCPNVRGNECQHKK